MYFFIYMTILMSRPTHFDVAYTINPWMNQKIPVTKLRAHEQWETLATTIRNFADVTEIPTAVHPDFVFTANAGLVHNQEVIVSTFKHTERQAEEPHWKKWFEAQGFHTHTLRNVTFEGAGDALFSNANTLIGGYGFRTEHAAYEQIASIWDIDIVCVELVDERFYHLDTCLCVLDDTTILYYKEAFSKTSQKKLQERYTCIEVSESEALHFACNAVVIDQHIILPSGATNVKNILRQAGYIPTTVEMTEFIKAGGAAKCLTLALP